MRCGPDRLSGCGRRLVPPDRVDQPIHRHDGVGAPEQECKHETLLCSTEVDHTPVVSCVNRTQDTKFHAMNATHVGIGRLVILRNTLDPAVG